MRWRPGSARGSAIRRAPSRVHRFVRPATVLLAAAIAWPCVVSVAGLKVPSPGAAHAPVVESRTDSGGSTQTRSTAPRPAASQPVTTIARTAPAATSAPVARASTVAQTTTQTVTEEPRKPLKTTVQKLDNTVTTVVDTTIDTTLETVAPVLDTVTGIVRGLLGR